MGIVRMGVPHELVLQLAQAYDVQHFIETGTYLGGTAVWAAQYFAQVLTIELSESIYRQTSTQYAHLKNIDFRFGDSRQVLTELAPTLSKPAIFWLDGHWSGGETYGADDQCPLLEEIQAINASPVPHYILIDDARLFTSTPPKPQIAAMWADISQVMDELRRVHDYFIVIIEDAIIAVPPSAKTLLQDYCQAVNTRAWEAYGREQSRSMFERSLTHLRIGAGLMRRALLGQAK